VTAEWHSPQPVLPGVSRFLGDDRHFGGRGWPVEEFAPLGHHLQQAVDERRLAGLFRAGEKSNIAAGDVPVPEPFGIGVDVGGTEFVRVFGDRQIEVARVGSRGGHGGTRGVVLRGSAESVRRGVLNGD
jgi:hypothetical protein